ncbi:MULTISPECIES: avidin/streptavidin family protein [unclassified Aureimonas]|uniref:avidin/streptavidin family protein n=1 Tax=unclassified Aureimonas TaxID=2615206 RepID=UPI0006F8D8F3|nr:MULTISPECIES: avidin/streptavidin family protein [unclassified Aureimonas]KQT62072.1 avidin [Aureimonas sp. Leaf427]KQT72348.1 avidin [Aureimonas sp. Leaf460]
MQNEQALIRSKPGTGTAVDFAGNWTNELGSKMLLVQTGQALSGSYESAVSSGGTTATGTLTGYVDGDLIAFIVHWDQFQAITSWVGQLAPNAPTDTIKTLWQMTNQVDVGDEWASINAGADVFTRQ